MPPLSTSAGRLYYLDGDRDVRYLAPDGSTGLATRVPGHSQAAAMFAVSPDDRRIAVAIFDYRSHPPAPRLYVEDLAGGTNRIEIPTSFGSYWRPVGWHAGSLVLAGSSHPVPWLAAHLPFGPVDRFQVLNPSNGQIRATLGDSGCEPLPSLPANAGVPCMVQYRGVTKRDTTWGLGIVNWSGKVTMFPTAGQFIRGASVSPDGNNLLVGYSDGSSKLLSSPATGSTEVSVTGVGGHGGHGGGWLDSTHVLFNRGGGNVPALMVVDIQTRSASLLVERMYLAGRLPGGL
jgi:hypothetical protein